MKSRTNHKRSIKRKILIAFLVFLIALPLYLAFDYYLMPLPSDFDNPPQFVKKDFIELWKIKMISKFRSFTGHDYSDSFEHNRSMKHYYCPRDKYGGSNTNISVFSPVDGRVEYIWDEEHRLSNGEIQGKQIGILVDGHLDFTVILFHINLFDNISVGQKLYAGEKLGYADTRDNCCIDIAISRRIGLTRERLYSYFQVMTDEVFSIYMKYGIKSRSEMIKPKELVDSLTPDWENYHEDDWVYLTTENQTNSSKNYSPLSIASRDSYNTKPAFRQQFLYTYFKIAIEGVLVELQRSAIPYTRLFDSPRHGVLHV